MPMDAPGIEIRPLRTIAGTTEFAELFLNEVRVPVANRVGRRERRLARHHGHALLRAGHGLRGRAARVHAAPGRAGPGGPAPRCVGGRRRGPPLRPPGGRLRRAVGPDQAQRLGGGADRDPRHRRVGLQALVLRARPGPGRPGHGDPRPGRAERRPAGRARRRAARQRGAAGRLVQVDLVDHCGGHVAGAAQHRGRAHPRAAQGRGADGLPRRRGPARAGRGHPGHGGGAAAARRPARPRGRRPRHRRPTTGPRWARPACSP